MHIEILPSGLELALVKQHSNMHNTPPSPDILRWENVEWRLVKLSENWTAALVFALFGLTDKSSSALQGRSACIHRSSNTPVFHNTVIVQVDIIITLRNVRSFKSKASVVGYSWAGEAPLTGITHTAASLPILQTQSPMSIQWESCSDIHQGTHGHQPIREPTVQSPAPAVYIRYCSVLGQDTNLHICPVGMSGLQ